jgi:E3 ubiquitin-protein ligase listerin
MYPEEVLDQFPSAVRSYLLAWHLIFDAYSKASYKVQNDYSESLKRQNFVEPFLNFVFDVLGHSAGHPLNLDKEGFTPDFIRSYDIRLANNEAGERNMDWLLIHLLFLTLKYIPGLFKMWFLDCRSKQTKVALEPWLEKYFSPLIISDVLDAVFEWAEKQEEPGDDEKELQVKVSRAAREVTAGYEIDDDQASIVIRIPPAFPLATCEVASVKRVAVGEEKWKNWLLATQGVIRFQVSRPDSQFVEYAHN